MVIRAVHLLRFSVIRRLLQYLENRKSLWDWRLNTFKSVVVWGSRVTFAEDQAESKLAHGLSTPHSSARWFVQISKVHVAPPEHPEPNSRSWKHAAKHPERPYCFFKLIKSQSKWQYTGRIKKKLNPDFSHQRLIYWEISPLPWKNYVFENIVITLENIKGGLALTKSDKSLSSASYFHSTTSDAVIYFHLKYSTVKWLQSTLYPKLKIVSWSLGLECLGFSSHVLDIWFPYFHVVDDVMTHRPRQEFGCKMQIF